MKRWGKEVLEWKSNQGIPTSINQEGEFDAKVSRYLSSHRRHEIISISAHLLYTEPGDQKRGIIKICIKQSHNVDLKTEVIKEHFNSSFADKNGLGYGVQITPPESASWTNGFFDIRFTLHEYEEFCDRAINMVRALFEALGVEDKSGHKLANFSLKHEVFVMLDNVWLPHYRWLRINHRLPVLDMDDMSN